MKEIVADDKLFTLFAQGMRKVLNAFVSEEFTEEQEIKIVAGQGSFKING